MKQKKITTYILTIKPISHHEEILRKLDLPSWMDPVFVIGVTPKEISSTEYFKLIAAGGSDRLITPREVSCSLGHLSIYKKILENDDNQAVILEDDVVFNRSGNDLLCESDFWPKVFIEDNIQFAFLGGQQGLASRKFLIGRVVKMYIENNLYKLHPKLFHYVYRSCCYYLTKETAKHLYHKQMKSLKIADDWRFLLRDYATSIYFINMLSHPTDLGESLIQSERLAIANQNSNNFFSKYYSLVFLSKFKIFRLAQKMAGYEAIPE